MSTAVAETPRPARRNRPGTRAADWCSWTAATSPTPPAEATDASFAVQQYLSEQERARRRAGDGCVELPPANVLSQAEEALWQFEQLRYAFEGIRLKCTSSKSLLCLELNTYVLALQEVCRCVDMRAGEWEYLCAAHQTPQPCPAMDYAVHAVDGATALLNSSKFFPSRISIPAGSVKHFGAIARRLYRVFAHAWYHHREVFDTVESDCQLYARFLAVTRRWELIPEKLIVIPDGDASKAASKTTSGTIHVQADTSDASNAAATTVLDDDDHGVSVMPVSITTELEDADDGPTMTVDDLLEMNSPDSPDSPENEMEQLRDADDASVPVTLDDDEDDDDLFTSTVVRE